METFLTIARGAAAGVQEAVLAAPALLEFIGFTSSGIEAGSFAASMMSAEASANRGRVAPGSLVARLQSAGAAGLSANATAALALIGGSIGAYFGWLGSFFQENRREENDSIVGWLGSFFQRKKEEKRREENDDFALGIVIGTLFVSAISLQQREGRGRQRNKKKINQL